MHKMRETLEDLLKDFGGRIRNPLIGSFLIVWFYQHWILLFQLFELDNVKEVNKINVLRDYAISHNGFCGMVLKPLFFSFISLAIFYLIGIGGQSIKIWFKKLNFHLLNKIDKPLFKPIEDFEKEKQYSRSLEVKLVALEKENREKTDVENAYNDLEIELNATTEKLEIAEEQNREYVQAIEQYKKDALKYTEIKKQKTDYILNTVRISILNILDYHLNFPNAKRRDIPVTDLFFESWTKTVFEHINVNKKRSEEVIYFEGKTIKDANQKFYSTITLIQKFSEYDVYYMELNARNDFRIKETLVRLEDGFLLGYVKHDNGAVSYVQYRKIYT